jgi:hypothetical protein
MTKMRFRSGFALDLLAMVTCFYLRLKARHRAKHSFVCGGG